MQYYFETNCNFYFETIYCTLHFFGRHLEWNGSKPPEPILDIKNLSKFEKWKEEVPKVSPDFQINSNV